MIDICLLGASGSIGRQTLDVMKKNPDDFVLTSFSVGHQTRKIMSILKSFPSVRSFCVGEENVARRLKKKYPNLKIFFGDQGLIDVVSQPCDMVVNALVGFVGLKPTLTTLEQKKILALANKESLVVGGELINDLLSRGYGKLFPIDSEHVAIAKCLAVDSSHVANLILTASGGAFRSLSREQLKHVKPEDALKHPTWKMGDKITIDCASMVNKAFEVIEAHYLFHYSSSHIQIVLHDESWVHSMVQYDDGSYRLDIGRPDMRVPIKYALYQGLTPFKTYLCADYHDLSQYHFHDFSLDRYPVVRWASKVLKEKGTFGAVLNAANEVAVRAFLDGKISFLDIETIIEKCMNNHRNMKHPTYDDLREVDEKTRQKALQIINNKE